MRKAYLIIVSFLTSIFAVYLMLFIYTFFNFDNEFKHSLKSLKILNFHEKYSKKLHHLRDTHGRWDFNDNVENYLFTMLRNHEISGKYTGATWVFIASTLSIAVFPKEIAVLSLVFMSIGDTTAGIIGRKFGRIKFYNKTFEGALAGLIVCLIIGLMMDLNLPNVIIIVGAFSAMIIELIPVSLDDNLRIPLFSGTIMYAMSIVLI